MMELAKSSTILKNREIAERQNIPIKYLEQIINTLKKNGLVNSIRGADGGYRLSRSPEQISVYEILLALEGDLSIIDKSDKSWQKEYGIFWSQVDQDIKKILEISLSNFLQASEKATENLMYYI